MSTAKTLQIKSTSSSVTERIGEQIGQRLQGGEVIQISSDLGGGKTTLVRGIARGAGSKDHVSSPTFTILNRYDSKKFPLYHYDFYRLQEPGLVAHELEESVNDPNCVSVIEWANIVEGLLPADACFVTINSDVGNENNRQLSITVEHSHTYLLEELYEYLD